MAFLRRWSVVALSLLLGAIAAYSAALVWKYGSYLSGDVWPPVDVFFHIRVVYVAAPMAVAIGLLSAVRGIFLRSRNSSLSKGWKPVLRTVLISALVSAASFWATWHVDHRPRFSRHHRSESIEAALAGLQWMVRDLEMAGFQAPPALAFHGMDGGDPSPME